MAATEYRRAHNVDEALASLSDDCLVLAGGTDLVTMRAHGAAFGRILLDIKHIDELRGVARTTSAVSIGATTTMRELALTRDVGLGALADGAGVVGAAQTRNRATIGGNVCRSSPAGDTLAPLLVLGAKVRLGSSSGERRIDLDRFFVGPGRNMRRGDELLTRLEVPTDGSVSAYLRYTYRAWMDLAVVGLAVRLKMIDGQCASASVAIAGAAPTPLLIHDAGHALTGSTCGTDAIDAAARAVQRTATPIEDVRGTREHRLRVLGVLTRRAIAIAQVRAHESNGRPG